MGQEIRPYTVGFPGGSVVKSPPANAGDTGDVGLIPGPGRCPGEGSGYPFQYSCLENPTDRGAWWASVHGVAKSQTWLSHWACMLSRVSQESKSTVWIMGQEIRPYTAHSVCTGGQIGACRQVHSETVKRRPQRKMQRRSLCVAPTWVCREMSGGRQQLRRGRASWTCPVFQVSLLRYLITQISGESVANTSRQSQGRRC